MWKREVMDHSASCVVYFYLPLLRNIKEADNATTAKGRQGTKKMWKDRRKAKHRACSSA